MYLCIARDMALGNEYLSYYSIIHEHFHYGLARLQCKLLITNIINLLLKYYLKSCTIDDVATGATVLMLPRN